MKFHFALKTIQQGSHFETDLSERKHLSHCTVCSRLTLPPMNLEPDVPGFLLKETGLPGCRTPPNVRFHVPPRPCAVSGLVAFVACKSTGSRAAEALLRALGFAARGNSQAAQVPLAPPGGGGGRGGGELVGAGGDRGAVKGMTPVWPVGPR